MLWFDRARRAALMEDLLRILTGRPVDLLPFDAVREQLKLTNFVDRGVQEVPLHRIVGSLGRDADFNRAFLPRKDSLREKWKRIRALVEEPMGLPPVELYRVGGVYFVVDGHHRVSVARSLGTPTIEAWVKEYLTLISLRPDETLEEVLLKGELTDFLSTTGLVLQNGEDYRVSEPGGYKRLLDHIATHRYFKNVEQHSNLSWDEAVVSWHDTVYRPMIESIRKSGVLDQFPGRTETDLYLFTMDHLHYLRKQYGKATPAQAVAEVKASQKSRKWSWLRRLFGASALALMGLVSCARSESGVKELLVSAASDLQPAYQEIGALFERENDCRVIFNFGSSGELAQQIEAGARVDVFASANLEYVEELERKGLVIAESKTTHAQGRITMWTRPESSIAIASLASLTAPVVRHIAIANPDHAPYGVAAREALQSAGIWAVIQPKMVYGQNVRQAQQFAETGNADVAIIALSLSILSPGQWTLIPSELHRPINQAMVIPGATRDRALADAFLEFVDGPKGRAIMQRYGFTFPEKDGP